MTTAKASLTQTTVILTSSRSVLIISNNGDGCPIALERDFTLTVAEPVTETYTPTVTLPISKANRRFIENTRMLLT